MRQIYIPPEPKSGLRYWLPIAAFITIEAVALALVIAAGCGLWLAWTGR